MEADMLLENLFKSFGTKQKERIRFFNKFLSLCQPADLFYLAMKLDEIKLDFMAVLPIEIVEIILGYLDWKTLLNCAQVSSMWERKISNDFNSLWLGWCLSILPVNELKLNEFEFDFNYKRVFIETMRNSAALEKGSFFRNWSVGPTDIGAIYVYENVVATASHIVNFWRLKKLDECQVKTSFPNLFINNEDFDFEWTNFKRLELNTRAIQLKFDNLYLITTTYFLSIEIYCVNNGRFLQKLVGHTCQITCFDFSQYLGLIASGSADYTLKIWSIQTASENLSENSENCLIASEFDKIWPIRIQIERCLSSSCFLLIILSINGFIYVKSIETINDKQINSLDEKEVNNSQSLNFSESKFLFGSKFNLKLNAQFIYKNLLNDENDILLLCNRSYLSYYDKNLVAYLVSKNNASQQQKVYIRKWNLDMTSKTFKPVKVNNTSYEFLNQISHVEFGIKRYEIIAFGLSYCLFVDENDLIYLSNLRNQTIRCIQAELTLTEKLRIFNLANSVQEQFIFADRGWLDGYDLGGILNDEMAKREKSILFAFFTQKINELFCVVWKGP